MKRAWKRERSRHRHTGARKRGEEKEQKAGTKREKEGKRGKPRIELVERKGEERQSEKESSFTRIRIQSACGVRASRIPSVIHLFFSIFITLFFHPMQFVFRISI